MSDDTPTIGDKIPPMFKPITQQVIGAIVTAALLWLVGQGLLAPTNQRLEAQTQQIMQQNAIMQANAEYWGVPVSTVGGK